MQVDILSQDAYHYNEISIFDFIVLRYTDAVVGNEKYHILGKPSNNIDKSQPIGGAIVPMLIDYAMQWYVTKLG